MRKPYIFLLSMVLFLLLTPVLWCKDMDLNSLWRKAEIMVDGKETEWSGSIYYLEEQKIGIGLQNDSANLYVIVKAMDRSTQLQIMRTGLTIWLDAKGKKKKTLGIHYPIGMQDYGIPEVRANQNTEFAKEQQNQFTEMLKEIEVLGPEKNDRNRMARVNSFGIEASLNDTLGVMIYELKIPLRPTDELPYAISSNPGDIISLGVETGKFNKEIMRGNRPMRGGMPGGRGGMPPGGGEPPGGMSPGGRERGKMMEPIDFWAKVALAKAASDKN